MYRPGGRSTALTLNRRASGEADVEESSHKLGADFLSVLRDRFLEPRLGQRDPHAEFFVTPAGRRHLASSRIRHPWVVRHTLARFQFFSSQMASAAPKFDQLLLLGIGFDTRALWLPELRDWRGTIFEVDLPETMAEKTETLRRHGIEYPVHVVPIGADLTASNLPNILEAHGFDRRRPTCVLLEGVVFLLPAEANEALFRPGHLGLAPTSRIAFDMWPSGLVDQSNAAFDKKVFQRFPFPDSSDGIRAALRDLGYHHIEVDLIGALAARQWPGERAAPFSEEYLMIQATWSG